MNQFILLVKDVLALFGGVAAIVFLTIKFCKQIIEKYIYTQIDNIANKELEKAKNSFARSMSAYEILLKKEFEYYQSIDKIYAKLIVDIKDIEYYSAFSGDEREDIFIEHNTEQIYEISKRILQAIKDLKDLNLIYQVYVPIEIFDITQKVYGYVQSNIEVVTKATINIMDNEICEKDKISSFVKEATSIICMSNACIKARLDELSKLE